MRPLPLLLALLVAAAVAPAQAAVVYRRPPEPIASLVEAEPSPDVVLSPDRRFLLFVHRQALPGIDVVARPHLKLAGLRVDPLTFGLQLSTQVTRLTLRNLDTGKERDLAVPPGHLGAPVWSADGRRLAFARAVTGGRELWLVDAETGACKQIQGVLLTAVLAAPLRWLPDQRTLLARLVVPGTAPVTATVPVGPDVQETTATKAPVRTFQDLLQNESDCALFEFYGQSQLSRIDADSGAVVAVGAPGLYARAEPSPDGEYLLVAALHRPFSFLVPHSQFPERTEVWDMNGKVVRLVDDHGLHDAVPIGGVPTGPRNIDWLLAHGHVLAFAAALDGGDPAAKVAQRDEVAVIADLAGPTQSWFKTQYRFAGIQCAEDGHCALVSEFDRDTRRQRVNRFDAADLAAAGTLLYERSTQDAYGDPGRPLAAVRPDGRALLRMRGHTLFFAGQGASKQGNRPFVDAFDLSTGKKQRLFESAAGRYEEFVGFLDDQGARALVASESPTEMRNYFAVELATGTRTPLSAFSDPAQQFTAHIDKRLLHYQRQDGVELSGTLYLPPGAAADQKLPCLVWAYPQEFTQASDAGQVRSSPNRYVRLAGISQLWMLLAGYAVFDDAAMPIVGPVRTANDTFVAQLCANAEAAQKALADTGRIDTARLAVGGHSYGAFMTANLLVHTKIFAAGIARSGAYNRTLTPFGFQNEERTYWQAPEVYQAMSPFAHADALTAPILLIHGEDDDNQGTFPIQSQRFFVAIKGHGGTARLCMLPHEAHGYRARESVQHCLCEMVDWLDRYVKPGKAAEASGGKK